MDDSKLEHLLRARFGAFLKEQAPPLERHPGDLAHPAPDDGAWARVLERGALRMPTPRAVGGLGLGDRAAVVIAELMGAAAFPAGRYLDALLSASLLTRLDADLVADLVSGAQRVAVAHREPAPASSLDCLPRWSACDDRHVSAARSSVADADDVDTLLVLGDGSPGILLVPAGDPAVLLVARSTLGLRRVFDIDLHEFVMNPGATHDLAHDVWTDVLAAARVRQAAYLVGLADGALSEAVRYARGRQQFGRRLSSFQSISFGLAAASGRTHAARLLVRDLGARSDVGGADPVEAAAALAMAAEVARDVAAFAVHVHGASGTALQSRVQRYFRAIGAESVWLGTPPELRRLALTRER